MPRLSNRLVTYDALSDLVAHLMVLHERWGRWGAMGRLADDDHLASRSAARSST